MTPVDDGTLDEAGVDPDPFGQFERWFSEAVNAGVPQPDSMVLATAAADGSPSVRMVLFKGIDRRGLVFYTNHRSRKAAEIAENPRAAVAFFWVQLRRQVRVTGGVTRLPDAESRAYFATRLRGAQLAAWASPQSEVIVSRDDLERRFREVEQWFGGRDVPLPRSWGGYRLAPETFEFWQGRENRLHDRLRYRPDPAGAWTIERLAP